MCDTLSSRTAPKESSFDHCVPLFAISSKLVPVLRVNVESRHSFFHCSAIGYLCSTCASWPRCRQCRTGTGVLAFGRALPCPVQASDGLRPALPCPVTAFGRRTGFQSQCSVALSASWVRIMSLLSLCRHRCLQRSLQSPMSSPP